MEKIKDTIERLWYAQKTIEHGWSRSVLAMWIGNRLYHKKGKSSLPTVKEIEAELEHKTPNIENQDKNKKTVKKARINK